MTRKGIILAGGSGSRLWQERLWAVFAQRSERQRLNQAALGLRILSAASTTKGRRP